VYILFGTYRVNIHTDISTQLALEYNKHTHLIQELDAFSNEVSVDRLIDLVPARNQHQYTQERCTNQAQLIGGEQVVDTLFQFRYLNFNKQNKNNIFYVFLITSKKRTL